MTQRRLHRLPTSGQPAPGFTLLELLVTAAVLVVLSSVSFPVLVRSYEDQKLRQGAIELQGHLLRSRTLARRLQSPCSLSISSGDRGATVQVSGTTGVTNNACADTNLPVLNLSAETAVRGLCISDVDGTRCSTPAGITFLPLGVLAGASRTLYLSGSATATQFCVDVSLTLIRVGFRNANSGACTYSRS